MRVRISKQSIDAAVTDALLTQSSNVIWDTEQRGFAVRVGAPNDKYPNGKITYFVQKRVAGRRSKEIRFVFGQYPTMDIQTARNAALSLISDIRSNVDIAKERNDLLLLRRKEAEEIKTKRFEDVFEAYRRSRSDGSYYWEKDIVYYAKKYYKPSFHNIAVSQITKDDVRQLLKGIPKKGAAKKAEAQLRPFFKYCVREEIITHNPMLDLAPLPKLKARDRVLSKPELIAFWKATEEMKAEGSLFGHVYQLLIVTGQRLRELAHMEHSELNVSDQIFHLSSKRSKNGLAHIVHLSPIALQILSQAPNKSKQFVFSYNGRKLSGFSVSKGILEKKMAKHLGTLQPFQLRDLRRTFATMCAELQTDPNVVDRILNHVSDAQSGVKGVYQKYEFMPQRKEAMLTWGRYVERFIANAR